MKSVSPACSDELNAELRAKLHEEVHARPPQELRAPLVVSHRVMWIEDNERAASRQHLVALLAVHGLDAPADDAAFVRIDLGRLSLLWELHTEFAAWTFFRPLQASEIAALATGKPPTADELLDEAWLRALPGRMLTGVHLWALPRQAYDTNTLLRWTFGDRSLTGSSVISHSSDLHTDFHLYADGCLRIMVFTGEQAADQVTPHRLGRLIQRVLEIETYRMASMLAFPVARRVVGWLAEVEAELAELAQAIGNTGPAEADLLNRLTDLAAQLEAVYAATHVRFSASAAYDELLRQRLDDIAEERIDGMQSLRDFMERRLAPAMATCRSADRRQAALSARIARIADLLRTRVEVEQQRSSRKLLAAMNRRQGLQLKLQSTVEGLSVAAITYYVVGLVGHLAKGAQRLGWPIGVQGTMAVAVPVVAISVWLLLRRVHRRIAHSDTDVDMD